MGFFSRFRRGIRNGVRGDATVLECTVSQAVGGSKRWLTLELAVSAPGIEPTTVTHECRDFDGIAPAPSTILPVRFDRDDPTRIEVLWHEVPPAGMGGSLDPDGARRFRDLIEAVRADPERLQGAHVIQTSWTAGTGSAVVDGEPFDPDNPTHVDFMRRAEAAVGVDLDGDGVVSEVPSGSPPPPPPPAFAPPDVDGNALERVQALERLAALRAAGALTVAEFEAEKARLLSDD